MTSSLAAFAGHLGDGSDARGLVGSARQQLRVDRPRSPMPSSPPSLRSPCHGRRRTFDPCRPRPFAGRRRAALCWGAALAVGVDFRPAKVAAHRLACAVRLRPGKALCAVHDAGPLLAGRTKQAGLWRLRRRYRPPFRTASSTRPSPSPPPRSCTSSWATSAAASRLRSPSTSWWTTSPAHWTPRDPRVGHRQERRGWRRRPTRSTSNASSASSGPISSWWSEPATTGIGPSSRKSATHIRRRDRDRITGQVNVAQTPRPLIAGGSRCAKRSRSWRVTSTRESWTFRGSTS